MSPETWSVKCWESSEGGQDTSAEIWASWGEMENQLGLEE